jgi:hypothetical protein
MPKRGDFFKSLEFPAIASDSPIAKFTIHSLPVSTNDAIPATLSATVHTVRQQVTCWSCVLFSSISIAFGRDLLLQTLLMVRDGFGVDNHVSSGTSTFTEDAEGL